MRRRAYIKVPRPTYTPVRTAPTYKYSPAPATQTQPMMKRTRNRRRTITGIAGPIAAWALRRVYNRFRRRGYESQKIKPGAGSTFSYYKSRQAIHPKARAVSKIATKQFYQRNASQRLESTVYGTQACTQFAVGTIYNLHNMVTEIPGTFNETSQIYIRDYVVDTEFTNQSEATVYFDLYEVTPRYTFGIGFDPVNRMNDGLVDQGVTGGATTLGSLPTMSTSFTAMYKIHKKYTIELSQGQSHRHVSRYNIGRRFQEELKTMVSADHTMPQFTRYLMVIASGAPLNDNTTKSNVSTATVALDIVRKERYRYFWSDPAITKYYYQNNLPTITAGSILDVGSGEPELLNVA